MLSTYYIVGITFIFTTVIFLGALYYCIFSKLWYAVVIFSLVLVPLSVATIYHWLPPAKADWVMKFKPTCIVPEDIDELHDYVSKYNKYSDVVACLEAHNQWKLDSVQVSKTILSKETSRQKRLDSLHAEYKKLH